MLGNLALQSQYDLPVGGSFRRSQRFSISLPVIKYCRTIFRLNSPVEVSLYVEDGLWNCESAQFSSLVSGNSPERALHCFCEDFSVLWEEIAKRPNEALAPDAQKLKAILLSAVKAVETEQ